MNQNAAAMAGRISNVAEYRGSLSQYVRQRAITAPQPVAGNRPNKPTPDMDLAPERAASPVASARAPRKAARHTNTTTARVATVIARRPSAAPHWP